MSDADHACCAPARPASADAPSSVGPAASAGSWVGHESMVALDGGSFLMGTDDGDGFPADGEGPVREVRVNPFSIDAVAVTNDRFARFVAATDYRTTAESEGWSFVFGGLLPDDFEPTRGVAQAPWWRQVFGADWAHPEGPQSTLQHRLDHPVVHVSWLDATAYCA
ncbi:MAG: SUMF1/EgtB/PvdO family nonheme iron enzyme, partial [Acidimicrobiales bacterium]